MLLFGNQNRIEQLESMAKNKSVSAAIGEYFVLGELLKKGAEAYLAHGETQKDWDIVIVHENGTKRVQVKTIDWPSRCAVNGKFKGNFDFLVVVLLDTKKPRSRFFVFQHQVIEPLLSSYNEKRAGGKRTLTMSEKAVSGDLAQYEDNWSTLLQGKLGSDSN